MSKFFSPTTRGFYSEDIHGKSMPADVVELPEEQWQALLDAESAGAVIRVGPGGHPLIGQPSTEVVAQARRIARDQLLSETDWLVTRHRDELEHEGTTTLSSPEYRELQEWRAKLRAMTTDPKFPNVSFPARPTGV